MSTPRKSLLEDTRSDGITGPTEKEPNELPLCRQDQHQGKWSRFRAKFRLRQTPYSLRKEKHRKSFGQDKENLFPLSGTDVALTNHFPAAGSTPAKLQLNFAAVPITQTSTGLFQSERSIFSDISNTANDASAYKQSMAEQTPAKNETAVRPDITFSRASTTDTGASILTTTEQSNADRNKLPASIDFSGVDIKDFLGLPALLACQENVSCSRGSRENDFSFASDERQGIGLGETAKLKPRAMIEDCSVEGQGKTSIGRIDATPTSKIQSFRKKHWSDLVQLGSRKRLSAESGNPGRQKRRMTAMQTLFPDGRLLPSAIIDPKRSYPTKAASVHKMQNGVGPELLVPKIFIDDQSCSDITDTGNMSTGRNAQQPAATRHRASAISKPGRSPDAVQGSRLPVRSSKSVTKPSIASGVTTSEAKDSGNSNGTVPPFAVPAMGQDSPAHPLIRGRWKSVSKSSKLSRTSPATLNSQLVTSSAKSGTESRDVNQLSSVSGPRRNDWARKTTPAQRKQSITTGQSLQAALSSHHRQSGVHGTPIPCIPVTPGVDRLTSGVDGGSREASPTSIRRWTRAQTVRDEVVGADRGGGGGSLDLGSSRYEQRGLDRHSDVQQPGTGKKLKNLIKRTWSLRRPPKKPAFTPEDSEYGHSLSSSFSEDISHLVKRRHSPLAALVAGSAALGTSFGGSPGESPKLSPRLSARNSPTDLPKGLSRNSPDASRDASKPSSSSPRSFSSRISQSQTSQSRTYQSQITPPRIPRSRIPQSQVSPSQSSPSRISPSRNAAPRILQSRIPQSPSLRRMSRLYRQNKVDSSAATGASLLNNLCNNDEDMLDTAAAGEHDPVYSHGMTRKTISEQLKAQIKQSLLQWPSAQMDSAADESPTPVQQHMSPHISPDRTSRLSPRPRQLSRPVSAEVSEHMDTITSKQTNDITNEFPLQKSPVRPFVTSISLDPAVSNFQKAASPTGKDELIHRDSGLENMSTDYRTSATSSEVVPSATRPSSIMSVQSTGSETHDGTEQPASRSESNTSSRSSLRSRDSAEVAKSSAPESFEEEAMDTFGDIAPIKAKLRRPKANRKGVGAVGKPGQDLSLASQSQGGGKSRRMSTPHPLKARSKDPSPSQSKPRRDFSHQRVRSQSEPRSTGSSDQSLRMKDSPQMMLNNLNRRLMSTSEERLPLSADDAASATVNSGTTMDCESALDEPVTDCVSNCNAFLSQHRAKRSSAPAVYAEALWDHVTLADDELSFCAGDVIEVVNARGKDWWEGWKGTNCGWFPAAFVRMRANQGKTVEELLFGPRDEKKKGMGKSCSVTGSASTRSGGGSNSANVPLVSKEKARCNVLKEIRSAETEYTAHLGDIVKGYIEKARDRPDLFKDTHVARIFSNMESLYLLGKRFVERLHESILQIEDLRVLYQSQVGDVFLEFSSKFEVYSEYCSNHPQAMQLLQSLREDSKYTEFLAMCHKERALGGIPLEGFLLTPVQKICKYPLQLKELLRYTPEGHPDRQPLEKALGEMKGIAELVNERKRRLESVVKIHEWQKGVMDWRDEDVLSRSTVLLHSGEFSVAGSSGSSVGWRGQQHHHFFLFDHQLIQCKRDGLSFVRRPPLVYKGRVDLDAVRIRDLPDGSKRNCQGVAGRNSIEITHNDTDHGLVLSARSKADKEAWLEALAQERDMVRADHAAGFVVSEEMKRMVLSVSPLTRGVSSQRSSQRKTDRKNALESNPKKKMMSSFRKLK